MNDIIQEVKFLEESGLLIKSVNKTIKNEAKEQKEGCPSMLLGTLGASLLGNLLTGKVTVGADEGAIATSQGRGTITADEGETVKGGQNFNAISFFN